MAEYHVGCGLFDIFAGTLKSGSDEWRTKSEVTNEALKAVATYLLFAEKEYRFKTKDDGKEYVMKIERRRDGETD